MYGTNKYTETYSGLAEALLLVAPGSVGEEGGVLPLHGDVVLQRDVADLNVIEGPGTTNKSGRKKGEWGLV